MQSSVIYRFQLFGSSPNLVLIVASSWVLIRGLREGLVFALASGFFLDALSSGPFGLLVVALAAAAWLSGLGETNVFRTVRFLPYVIITLTTLVYYGVLIFSLQMTGRTVVWDSALWRVVLPELAANLLVMPLVFYGLRWIGRKFRPKPVEWT